MRDTANAVAAARRLFAVDPLNRTSIRIVAQAWDVAGRRDSAQRYQARADSIPVDITVSSFVPESAGYILTAVASNSRSVPSRPLRLSFEFLDAQGSVLATRMVDIPAIAGGQSSDVQVRASGQGIVGWRYRPSAAAPTSATSASWTAILRGCGTCSTSATTITDSPSGTAISPP